MFSKVRLQSSSNSALSNPSPWFVCPQANPKAEIRLFFFPYAGSGPPAFGKWPSKLPNNIETFIAHYPGRGSRYQEPPIKSINTLIEKLTQAIQPLIDKPFALFGHSLGGLVAFELTRQLLRQNLALPQILFISACGAPNVPDSHPPIHTLPDDEFLRTVSELNGVPSELQGNAEILELLLPVLRADFETVECYRYHSIETPLTIPIIAYGGQGDARVSRERLDHWSLLTNAKFKSQFFPGNHFFINTARESVVASIIKELALTNGKD